MTKKWRKKGALIFWAYFLKIRQFIEVYKKIIIHKKLITKCTIIMLKYKIFIYKLREHNLQTLNIVALKSGYHPKLLESKILYIIE